MNKINPNCVSDISFSKKFTYETVVAVENGLIDSFSLSDLLDSHSIRSRHFIITDDRVDQLYGERVLSRCLSEGLTVEKLVIPEGDASKCMEWYEKLATQILQVGIDKHSCLISVGGGVVNNIAGFLASTLYRGIGLIHFPTSMMAQVDAAIDFKQAINSPKGKNLIGSYYPASYILIDPNVLSTLSSRHVANGISEAIKHALIQDSDFYRALMNEDSSQSDASFLRDVITKSIELKIELMHGDENDDKNEMSLQYGHCVGHSIEHLSKYTILHGEAIAIGMCVSAEVAYIRGICTKDVVDAHYTLFSRYALPTSVPYKISNDQIFETIYYDKHFVKKPFMALPCGIGAIYNDQGTHAIAIDQESLYSALETNRRRKQ